jgi:Sulfotransferase family
MDPILIVGSPRSGTTALALGLTAAGISGFSEGHFLRMFARIEQTIAQYYKDEAANNVPGTLLNAIPIGHIVESYRRTARSITDAIHNDKIWFDKTAHGGMVGSLPFFKSLWPQAKIIYAKRRPIENLESRLKKFNHMSFANHCQDLKYIFQTWATMRHRIDDWLEVDQYDLFCEPIETTKVISKFLHLEPGAERAFCETIANTRPERTTTSYAPRKFSELSWPESDKKIFVAELDGVMKLFRYGYEEYFDLATTGTGQP